MAVTFALHAQGEEADLYSLLYENYYDWSENFYGADRFYYRTILSILHEHKGTEFKTPAIFMKIDQEDSSLVAHSIYTFSSWLTITVSSQEEAAAAFLTGLTPEERILGLSLSISGTVDRYSVDFREKEIRIRLQSVTITPIR